MALTVIPPVRSDGPNVRVRVHLQPRASRDRVVGLHDNQLKIALSAPPVDGKANAALCAFIAGCTGVSKGRVAVVSGETSRHKELCIQGVTAEDVEKKLLTSGDE